MKRTPKKALAIVGTAVLIVSLLSSCADTSMDTPTATSNPTVSEDSATTTNSEDASASEFVLIGTVNDVSGVSATSGIQQVNGQRLAVDDINDAGGVLGKPLKMELADGKCSGTDGLSATNSLISKGVVAMMGPLCSVACTAAMPPLDAAGIASITAGCATQDIAEQAGEGGFDGFFILPPPESDLARIGAKALKERLGYKTAALLGRDDGFGRGVVEGFETELPREGIEVLSSDLYKPGTSDYRAVLQKMASVKPDVFVMASQIDEAPIILQQKAELGLKEPISGRVQIFSESLYDALGGPSAMDGYSFFSPWEPFAADVEGKKFIEKYRAAYNEEPIWQAYYGYVTTQVLAAAIDQAGSEDPASIKAAIKNVDITTPFGKVVWDEHNQFHPNVYIGIMTDGKPELLAIESASE